MNRDITIIGFDPAHNEDKTCWNLCCYDGKGGFVVVRQFNSQKSLSQYVRRKRLSRGSAADLHA